MTIRTILVDDHNLIRQGLHAALQAERDIQVVAEAVAVRSALAAIATTEHDVVVTDLGLPDGNGLEVVRAARKKSAGIGIVVLTMYEGDEHLFEALDAGASAFVSKRSSTDEVITAVRHTATAPGTFMAQGMAAAMRRRMSEQQQASTLTAREREVLDLLGTGLSTADIAKRLYMSTSTAKTHISRVYEKLGAHNRTEAVLAAMRLGILEKV
jgi:DNA-binding NarL/FixJ family response regulator